MTDCCYHQAQQISLHGGGSQLLTMVPLVHFFQSAQLWSKTGCTVCDYVKFKGSKTNRTVAAFERGLMIGMSNGRGLGVLQMIFIWINMMATGGRT